MANKIILNRKDLDEWLDENWTLYASQTVRNDLLIMEVNMSGSIRVSHGNSTLYRGDDINYAIHTWHKV